MRVRSALVSMLFLAAGCKGGGAGGGAAATTAAAAMSPSPAMTSAAPTPTPGRWAIVGLYGKPKSPAAFEKYYSTKHIPLFASSQKEIGYTGSELIKFTTTLDGKPAPKYRMVVVWFDSQEALEKGTATPAFGKVVADLKNFATGGFTPIVAQEDPFATPYDVHKKSVLDGLYGAPKDPAAFEKYYAETHMPLFEGKQKDVGFIGWAALKLLKTPDGGASPYYRMIQVWFDSDAKRKAGLATPAFGEVAGNLKNFADGGFTPILGDETSP